MNQSQRNTLEKREEGHDTVQRTFTLEFLSYQKPSHRSSMPAHLVVMVKSTQTVCWLDQGLAAAGLMECFDHLAITTVMSGHTKH